MVELKSKYEYNDSSIRYSTKRKKMKKSEMFKKDLLELFVKYGVFDVDSVNSPFSANTCSTVSLTIDLIVSASSPENCCCTCC